MIDLLPRVAHEWIERFDDAWQAGAPSELGGFYGEAVRTIAPPLDESGRRALLAILIEIELEHRWQREGSGDGGTAGAGAECLEGYAARFPELGAPGDWPDELIVAEYACRRRWGDRPELDRFLERFPSDRRAALLRRLEAAGATLPFFSGEAGDGLGVLPELEGLKLGRELGRGAFGVVYQAEEVGTGRLVAVKMLLPAARHNPMAEAWLEVEARAIAKLKHDHIVTIHRVGRLAGAPYLVFEYMDVGTLAEKLRREPIPPREGARLLRTLADALESVHRLGIFHRDLKPANILLEQSGRAKIGDFGLARLGEGGHTIAGVPLGTPSYMSPEQASGHAGQVAAGTDIYALGAILYEILTGRPPFTGTSPQAVLHQVIHAEPVSVHVLNPRIDRDLVTICEKCLEKEPARRFVTAAALRDELGRYLDGLPLETRPPGRLERLARAAKRKPVLAGLYAAATAAVIFGAIGILYFRKYNEAEVLRVRERKALIAAEYEHRQADAVRAQRKADHNALVQAGNDAARRGDWSAALRAYQHAIDDHAEDETRLRASRLFGFFAVNDKNTLMAELDALAARPDLGRYKAHLALVRGAYLLTDSALQAEGQTWVRRALEARDDLLSPADVAFAEALLETRPLPMIAALRRALERDPLHYNAQASLVIALVASGQLDDAAAQARQMAALYPDSAVPPLASALAALYRGDRPAMEAGLTAVAARLKADVAPLKQYLNTVAEILDIMAQGNDGPAGVKPMSQFRLFVLLPRMVVQAGTAVKPLAFAVPSVNLLFRWQGELFETSRSLGKSDDATYHKLVALGAGNPEALIHGMIATNRLMAANRELSANHPAEARRGLAEAADLAYRACEAPTLLVRSPTRYQMRAIGMVADVGVLKLTPDDEGERIRRLRANLHRLVVDGRAWPETRRQFIGAFINMAMSPLTPPLEAEWKLDSPAGAEGYRQRKVWLEHVSRNVLDDWRDDDPADQAVSRLQAELDKGSEQQARPAAPAPAPR
jgi:tetratricopeptide (TPR) repeat protein